MKRFFEQLKLGTKETSASDPNAGPGSLLRLQRLRRQHRLPEQSGSSANLDQGKNRATDQGKTLSEGDFRLPYEQSYEFNLERARRGAKKFEELYKATQDKQWKDALAKSQSGAELQALYLGIKPYGNFITTDGKPTLPLEIIKDHLVDDLEVTQNGDVFSRNIVQKILSDHQEYFPDYDGASIGSYLSQRGSPYVPDDAGEQRIAQGGLLFGFPPDDAIKYAKYALSCKRIKEIAGYIDPDNNEEMNLFSYFLREGVSNPEFLDQNKNALYSIIDKYTHKYNHFIGDIAEGTKEYVVGQRKVSFPGFVYLTDNPQSAQHREFEQRVRNAFEQSGMNDFIRQIANE